MRSCLSPVLTLPCLLLSMGFLSSCGGGVKQAGKPAAPLSNNAYRAEGLCAFEIPAGWTIAEFPGLKYRIVHAQPTNGFAPNLNVVEEKNTMDIKNYAAACQKSLEQTFKDFRLDNSVEFMTNAGASGFRITYTATQNEKLVRIAQYLFDSGKDTKIIVTFTRLDTQDVNLDAQVDEKLMTFIVE